MLPETDVTIRAAAVPATRSRRAKPVRL